MKKQTQSLSFLNWIINVRCERSKLVEKISNVMMIWRYLFASEQSSTQCEFHLINQHRETAIYTKTRFAIIYIDFVFNFIPIQLNVAIWTVDSSMKTHTYQKSSFDSADESELIWWKVSAIWQWMEKVDWNLAPIVRWENG